MKKINLDVCALSLALLLDTTGSAANWKDEYWIADRTDGANGDGSWKNPYNGHGADRFDTNLASIPRNSVIHILPGTYETHGYKNTARTNYISLKNGWRLKGSGIDLTTLKLIDCNSDKTNNSGWNTVLFSGFTGGMSNISVTDLTIDCNYAGVKSNTGLRNLSLAGVFVFGDGCSIERVKVVHASGLRSDLGGTTNPEAFIIGLGAFSPNSRAAGLLIRDCEVSAFAGGLCTAISISPGSPSTANSGIIHDNRVQFDPHPDGGQFAYSGYGAAGLLIESNFSWNADRGINLDSVHGTNLVVRGNFFLDGHAGALLGTSTNSIFENNLIEVTGSNHYGIVMGGRPPGILGAGGWIIRNNIVRNKSGARNYGLAWLRGTNNPPPNCTFENNRFSANFLHNVTEGPGNFWLNNTDTAGNTITSFPPNRPPPAANKP